MLSFTPKRNTQSLIFRSFHGRKQPAAAATSHCYCSEDSFHLEEHQQSRAKFPFPPMTSWMRMTSCWHVTHMNEDDVSNENFFLPQNKAEIQGRKQWWWSTQVSLMISSLIHLLDSALTEENCIGKLNAIIMQRADEQRAVQQFSFNTNTSRLHTYAWTFHVMEGRYCEELLLSETIVNFRKNHCLVNNMQSHHEFVCTFHRFCTTLNEGDSINNLGEDWSWQTTFLSWGRHPTS